MLPFIKKQAFEKNIYMNEAKLLLDMVAQKLASKERFPITQKMNFACY